MFHTRLSTYFYNYRKQSLSKQALCHECPHVNFFYAGRLNTQLSLLNTHTNYLHTVLIPPLELKELKASEQIPP